MRCSVCGTEVNPKKEARYTGRNNGKTGAMSLFGENQEEQLYDCFDCPICGCQIVAQERKRKYEDKEAKGEITDNESDN